MRFLPVCPMAFLLWLALVPLSAQPTAPPPVPGPSDLMLIPTRVVLEGRQRATEIILKNIGKATATYRIQLKEMVMTPTGQLKDREKASGEITAADLVRFSPRQVELSPGETQTVRIQVRKPEQLADGEYRSHMLFQGIPPAEAPQAPEAEGEKRLSFSITPIYGIAIPIIVRHGEVKTDVALVNVRYEGPGKEADSLFVLLSLERSGNGSVLGDFEVSVESGGSVKKGQSLMLMRGVAVYHPNPLREVVIPLRLEKGASLSGARLKVTYTPQDTKLPPLVATLDVP